MVDITKVRVSTNVRPERNTIPSLRRSARYLRTLNQSVYEDLIKLLLARKDQRIQLADVLDTLADIEEACLDGKCSA